jgi:hypothetical protein
MCLAPAPNWCHGLCVLLLELVCILVEDTLLHTSRLYLYASKVGRNGGHPDTPIVIKD